MQRLDPVRALREGYAKLRMLIVGVNHYQDQSLRSLSYAVNDCEAFSEALSEATSEFQKCEIVTHTGMEGESPFSSADLQASLDRLLHDLQPQDTFLFYFSGHGVLDPETQQLYLCLPQTQIQDLPNTGLSISAVLKRIKDSQVGKQVLILDACHSGSVTFGTSRDATPRSQSIPTESVEPDPKLTPKLEETLRDYASGATGSICALLSCSAEQKSWELDDLEHGVFTYYLVEGVRGSAEDEEGQIEIDQLFKFVRNRTEQHLRPKGKPQVPHRITAGSHDIIIGLGGLGEGISTIGGVESAPEEEYRRRVRQALLEQRDLDDPEIQQALAKLARGLFLSEEGAAQLREQARQNLAQILQNYVQDAIELLGQQGRSTSDQFAGLRSGLRSRLRRIWKQNLKPEAFKHLLTPVEQEAIAHFQQHQDNYLEAFSREIHHQPTLSPETHQELRSPLVNLGFSDGVIDSFEAEAWQALEQHQQTYRVDYRSAIYQYESPDGEALDQLQQQLGLGDRLVNLIESEQDDLCNQQKQAYRQEFAQAIHTNLMAAPVQDRRDLGAEILDRIEAEETEQCDRHKQDYRQRYAHLIRQHALRNQDYNELEQVRQQCGFSHSIVEALEAQENIDFEQGKQAYREAYCTALHQEQPLSDVGLDLLRQLQAKLNLGAEIVTSLESDAAETFDQNRQRYFREYVSTIRQREKLAPNDRHRLSQAQQRLGLSNQVVDLIWQSADAAVEADKKNYRSTLDEALRYPEDTIAQERLVQMRQRCELGEELRQSLETEVERLVGHDRNEYCDVLVSELHGACPLSLEAQHRLRQLQNHLRLGDTIVAEVRETVTQDFGRRREEEERDREEARRQEEKTQEAARKREEARRQEEERKREALNSESSPLPIPAVPILIAPIVPVPLDETPIDLTPEPPQPPSDSPRKFPLWAVIVAWGVVGAIGLGSGFYLLWVPTKVEFSKANSNLPVESITSIIKGLKQIKPLKKNSPGSPAEQPKPPTINQQPVQLPAPIEPISPAPTEPSFPTPVEPEPEPEPVGGGGNSGGGGGGGGGGFRDPGRTGRDGRG